MDGTVTTQWHRSNPDSWEQFWIWWCWHERELYTMYVHSPNGALIQHWAEPGVHTAALTCLSPAITLGEHCQPKPSDDLLMYSEHVLEIFPRELPRFEWDFEVKSMER